MVCRAAAAAFLLSIGAVTFAATTEQSPVEAALIACRPATFDAAVDCLDKHLPQADQTALARTDGPIEAHFGLGMWIRNNWGLWKRGSLYHAMTAYGFAHPDDMSGAILEGFSAKERGESFDLAGKAAQSRVDGEKMWSDAVKEGRAGSCQLRDALDDRKFEEDMDACLGTPAKKDEPR